MNSALEKLIQRRFGEEMWQEIRAKAAVVNGNGEEERGTFMTHFIYDDQITSALVTAAVEILGVCVCVCVCVCVRVRVCLCMYMHACVYICTDTNAGVFTIGLINSKLFTYEILCILKYIVQTVPGEFSSHLHFTIQ